MLNLCLPLYNLIYAIGSMVGVGSATRFTILKAQGIRYVTAFSPMLFFCFISEYSIYAGGHFSGPDSENNGW